LGAVLGWQEGRPIFWSYVVAPFFPEVLGRTVSGAYRADAKSQKYMKKGSFPWVPLYRLDSLIPWSGMPCTSCSSRSSTFGGIMHFTVKLLLAAALGVPFFYRYALVFDPALFKTAAIDCVLKLSGSPHFLYIPALFRQNAIRFLPVMIIGLEGRNIPPNLICLQPQCDGATQKTTPCLAQIRFYSWGFQEWKLGGSLRLLGS